MAKLNWSAAARCVNWAGLSAQAAAVAEAGCDEWHADVSDGRFAPALSLGFEAIEALRASSTLPIHAHLLMDAPERHIDAFVRLGCAGITVHVETSIHIHRTVHQIKDAGVQAGIAISPATPLTRLEYLLPYADRVHLLLTEPFTDDPRVHAASLERVKILRSNLDYLETRAELCVEGADDAKTAAIAAAYGANRAVLDAKAVYASGDLTENAANFFQRVETERKTV